MNRITTVISSLAGLFLTAQAAMGRQTAIITDIPTLNQIAPAMLLCPKTTAEAKSRPETVEKCARDAVRGATKIAIMQSRHIGGEMQTDKFRRAQAGLNNCIQELETLDGKPLGSRGVPSYVDGAAQAINKCEAALVLTDEFFRMEFNTDARRAVSRSINELARLPLPSPSQK